MKNVVITFLISVLIIFSQASVSQTLSPDYEINYPTGMNILNYEGMSFKPKASGFKANWTAAGNIFRNATSYNFTNLETDDIDVLLLPRLQSLSADDIVAIKTWFDLGDKLVWVSGDSDFEGFYNSEIAANPLLVELGSVLRLSAIGIEDQVSNDDAAYRVLANQKGGTSNYTDYVTQGFELMSMNGPTAIHYVDSNGSAADLRNATIGEGRLEQVDVHIKTSTHAIAIDQDNSSREADLYANSSTTGNYPMLATETINRSLVVVSGEAIFTDFKFMYGISDESGGDPHQGAMVVDRVISYFYQDLIPKSDTSPTTPTLDSPDPRENSSVPIVPSTSLLKLDISLTNLTYLVLGTFVMTIVRRKRQ